ncbi:hypothetical protein BDN71DRAFT_1594824, partial [Pleurotus eryngii]
MQIAGAWVYRCFDKGQQGIQRSDDGGLSSESSDEEEDDVDEPSDYTTAASSPLILIPPTPSEEKAAITRIQTSAPKPILTSRPLFRETWVHHHPRACWGEQDANAASHCYAGPYYGQVQRLHFEDEVQARVVEVNSSSLMASTPSTSTPSTPSATTPPSLKLDVGTASKVKKKKRFRKKKTHEEYHFGASNDIVGIVMLEIHGADDLPRLENMTRTGWDMDSCVIRHSLNPVWDEKLLFHVRRYETAFKVQLSILDWDKYSSNDHVGDLIEGAPQLDPNTGLYATIGAEGHPMKEYKLPLATEKDVAREARHKPVITVKY